MKKLQFNIQINAPAAKVYDKMLGIKNKTSYAQWTALFNPTSTYEGNWNKGSRILFIGTNENGEKGGMVSEIKENIPERFVSVRHIGLLKGNDQITDGPDVEKWAGALENYSFEESNGVTIVSVEMDSANDYVEYMNQTYPKALNKLKEICEQ